MTPRPLWSVETMAAAMGAMRAGPLPHSISGISIDTRTIAPGEAFFAIKGENRDGHDFVEAAHKARGGLAVVDARKAGRFAADAPLLIVSDVLEGLRELARAARRRSQAKIVAVTGSVGKTGTKEALRVALGEHGETHASAASYNNHWGVPLSLARCPESARFAVFELGMNHAGEIEPLARLVNPQVAIITAIEPVHLEFFDSLAAIADAKAEIFFGLQPGGVAVINRDNAQFPRLEQNAQRAGVERIVSFGEHVDADARLMACSLHSDSSDVEARIFGTELSYRLGAPGRHVVLNSLAVLAAAALLGGDVRRAAVALAHLPATRGRGARIALDVPGGTILLIDESYNANPASMRAALALLGQAQLAAAKHGRAKLGQIQASARSRRIAVLGDMLELGPSARELHRNLADAVGANDVDLVYCCGPLMQALWEALPSNRRGRYAETSAELQTHVLAGVGPGDIVMVKGSLGSRMALIVKALENQVRREPLSAARSELRS
jgi:UDP-N-acetylmuramoyl-tripeptide--D-alanyl-D-alanine ligase